MEKEIRMYIKRIKALMSLNSKEEKKFLTQLRNQIQQSYNNEEFYDYEGLVSAYGTPNEVATSYLETQDPDRFIKYIKIKKFIAGMIIAIILAVIITSSLEMYRLNQLYDEARQSLYLHEETTIVELPNAEENN